MKLVCQISLQGPAPATEMVMNDCAKQDCQNKRREECERRRVGWSEIQGPSRSSAAVIGWLARTLVASLGKWLSYQKYQSSFCLLVCHRVEVVLHSVEMCSIRFEARLDWHSVTK